MTREKAKRLFAQYIDYDAETPDYYDMEEACKVAIQVLEQEPSGDVISRQAVLETLDDMDNVLDEDRTIENYKELLKECYEVLPSVKPQEKTGHWVKTPKAVMGEGYMWYCDKCEHQVYQDSSKSYPSEKFCPNCGAKMVEEQESEVQDADSN